MNPIRRIGTNPRSSDIVIYRGVARWVEVAEDAGADVRAQIVQVLEQIDATLVSLESDRHSLLDVLVFLADLNDAPLLNEIWDAWVPSSDAPTRACVGAALGAGYRIEVVVSAAVVEDRPT